MHFTVTQLGLVSECPGVTCTGQAFLPREPARAKAWVTSGEGDGSSLKLCLLHPATSSQLPSSIFGQGKDPLFRNCFRILSFWLLKNVSLAIGQDHHWKHALCDQLLLALWQQWWGRGAVTGAGRPGCLGYHSAASAGKGYLITSTSHSGLYSLDFIWNRKCWKNVEQHPQREKRMGPKGLRWKLCTLCSAGSSSQPEGCQHQQSPHTRASRAVPAQGTAKASLKTGLDLWAARGSLSAGGRDLKPKYNWRVRL